ncbi:MAG: NADH-ubiquinone oxidoreductase-F iron-sulfur binding region domain-containing protein [Jatrophihabitans sp.]|uniref:NADH-ubiquinone oxidoreductase-F iron-sulfur binding region domain-containing protein n=1 Tax=Jatrophihabitans sp. TaxID=1932789 RepID=UPI003F806864
MTAPLLFLTPVDLDASTAGVPPDGAAHTAAHGLCAALSTADLLDRVAASGLTGRGGGQLPVAVKWQRYGAGVRRVVANGAESEPDSRKDEALLRLRPHLVLDGLLTVGGAFGADEAVVWLHAESVAARRAIETALAERRATGGLPLPVTVRTTPGRYLAGESSAIVRALDGGPLLPVLRRPAPAGRPATRRAALVHNVETLARIGLLARGRAAAATVLLTVVRPDCHTVVERPLDGSLAEAVADVTGGASRAVLVGGYGGRWASWAQLQGVSPAAALRRDAPVPLGAGVLRPLGADECGLRVTAAIARHLADEGAGQCGPCRFGLPALADGLDRLLAGGRRARAAHRVLGEHLEQIAGRGACHHPDGAVAVVASALQVFAADVDAHRAHRCEVADVARQVPA